MLRPLTVRSPARLVAFTTAADGGWATWSYAAFARWQRLPASGGLYEVAAASDVRPFRSARGSGESPEEVPVSLVSHNYFDAIGARVVLGRPFAGRDAAAPGTGAVAIVSDGFWRRRFGGAPDVLARTIELGGVQFAVLGVAESGFTGLSVGHPADVWVPLTMQPALAPEMPGPSGLDESAGAEARWLKVVGRLADGASVERAEGAARLARQVFLAEKAARLGADKPEVARDRTESFRLVAGATGDGVVRAQFAPAADASHRHYRPGARRGLHQLHQPDVRARGSAAPRVPHPSGRRRRPVAPDPAVRGRMPGACRDCRRAGAAVRRLGDVDGDEPRLGARAARAARLRDRVEHACDGVCRRLRLHRRAVRPVAVHAAGAFDRDLLGASPHRRRWRASGRAPDHAHRPARGLRHSDVRRRPAAENGHQPAHAGPGIRARCAPDSDRSRTSWPSAGRCFRAGGRSAAADRDDPGRAGGRRLRIGAPRLRRVLGGWERAAADRSRRGCGRHQVDVCVRRTGLLRRRRHASGARSAVVGSRACG